MQTFLNVLVGLLGLASIVLGAIGFGMMTTLWRVLHVVAGIVLVWRALPVTTPRTTHAIAEEERVGRLR